MSAHPLVALTGASRYLGAHVARELSSRRIGVRAARRHGDPRWHVEDVDCQWRPIDLERRATISRFVDGTRALIHCDGLAPKRGRDVASAKRRGVRQLRNVLDTCLEHDIARVVYVSSATTLYETGRGEEGPRDESCQYLPGSVQNAYFEARAAMEAEVYRYVAAGLDVVVILPTVLFGPGGVASNTSRFVEAVATGCFPVVPEGLVLNVVDVRDAADAVVTALRRGRRGRRYALAGESISLPDLVAMIARRARRETPTVTVNASIARWLARAVENLAHRVDENRVPRLVVALGYATYLREVSSKRAEAELGFRHRDLETTIEDTLQWLCRVGRLGWSRGQLRRIRGPAKKGTG